jgi:arylsulfatase A-like enzyme
MPREYDFLSTVASLWFRLITVGILGLAFAAALSLSQGEAQGWTFYLTTSEVAFEVVVRLVFAALAGIALGTLCTIAIAPFLWHFKSSRERIAEWATKAAVVLLVFVDSRFALTSLIKAWWPNHGPGFTSALLTAHLLVFALALCIPRARKEVLTSIDGFLGERMTRRTAIATVVGTAALVATEFALSKTAPVVKAALLPQRPKSNILLITFDALSAEDMSLYGYRLPTTPNIDAFASKATVFKNFYSTSTFTTPTVATMLTGTYPSENHVYQIIGGVRAEDAKKSLPHAMRAAGYATGAFFSNPYAYYLADSLRSEYDFLPEPVFQPGGLQHLWQATSSLQDSGFGNRMDEYNDLMRLWNSLGGLPIDLFRRYRAVESFAHAQEMLVKLPDGFFLWVHVMTPHSPYHPDAADRGTFIPESQLRTFEDEGDDGARRWFPHYEPDQQSQVDQRRLAYDEFILTADRAFGSFMSELENSGKLRNTTVIVSADHGESFEGGVYQHENRYLTRPVIHIPLIIRTPEQQEGSTVAFTADQTALAPTILELAGQPKPGWMPGQSLVKWLTSSGQGEGEGLAFCQYLEENSIFKPLRHGTVGVIDGQYQYVVILSTPNGLLRPLSQSQFWNLDRTADDPARAQALRAAIYSRFPDLVQKPT